MSRRTIGVGLCNVNEPRFIVVNAIFTTPHYLWHMTSLPAPHAAQFTLSPASANWLAVAAMLTDLAFETDAMGCFTAFGPGKVLGQPAANLLGVEAASLLAGPVEEEALSAAQFRSIITTICMECVAWHGKVRLSLPGGGEGVFRLSLAPRLAGGSVIGTFGMLFDLEAPELMLPDSHAGRADDPALRHHPMLDAEPGCGPAAPSGTRSPVGSTGWMSRSFPAHCSTSASAARPRFCRARLPCGWPMNCARSCGQRICLAVSTKRPSLYGATEWTI